MKRQAFLTLNIGLENNPLTAEHIANKIFERDLFEHSTSREQLSSYEGKPERTLIIKGITNYKLSTIVDKMEGLCIALTQDCIALTYNKSELLVYAANTKIKPKDQLRFDSSIFIN